MKATPQHLQLNVSDPEFYRRLLTYLEGEIVYDNEGFLGFQMGDISLWIFPVADEFRDHIFNRKARGIHHLGFQVKHHKDVDHFYKDYLKKNNIAVLYGGPKEYPDFGNKYYAVKCEDPDGFVIEIFHKE